VGAAGKSAAIDIEDCSRVTAFGNTGGASTLTLEVSQDRVNWYAHPTTVAANGNFAQTWDIASRYVRISSGSAVTITATISGKN
jgi:hypothetical protein